MLSSLHSDPGCVENRVFQDWELDLWAAESTRWGRVPGPWDERVTEQGLQMGEVREALTAVGRVTCQAEHVEALFGHMCPGCPCCWG